MTTKKRTSKRAPRKGKAPKPKAPRPARQIDQDQPRTTEARQDGGERQPR